MTGRKQQLRDDIEARLRSAVDQFAAAFREEMNVRPMAAAEDRTVIRLSTYRLYKRIETFGSTTELAMAIQGIELALDQFTASAVGLADLSELKALSQTLSWGVETKINQLRFASQSYASDDAAAIMEWHRRLTNLTRDLHWIIDQCENSWADVIGAPEHLAEVISLADHRAVS